MEEVLRIYSSIGLCAADVLLPKDGIDLTKWAVIACDQFTSEPSYWEKAAEIIGISPSTYHLILPEVFLGTRKGETHQAKVNPAMEKYLQEGIFQSVDGFIFVERETGSGTRQGLVAALDLERYDFSPDSKSLIRATEGTIVDRLPPRIAIRKDAPLELPHILVLIDDPNFTVIQPLSEKKESFKKLYDLELMAGGGHLRGFLVNDQITEREITATLQDLASAGWQKERYGTSENPLLYAVGDGNHSLATAKSIWEKTKNGAADSHPARHALVELVNLHDPGITFEPIHRVIMNVNFDLLYEMESFYRTEIDSELFSDYTKLLSRVNAGNGDRQAFGWLMPEKMAVVSIAYPPHTLTVGSLQKFLDALSVKYPTLEIDYIHGEETIAELSAKPGNAGFVLPVMDKFKLFKAVIKDGPLPRKTFSMGEANEKRYYLECRKIKEG